MEILEIINPRYTNIGVDLNIRTVDFGWIWFHATPTDSVESGRVLYSRAIANEFGVIAPKVVE